LGSAAASLAIAQPPERREAGPPARREGAPPDGPGGPQFRVLPPFAQRELQLTAEQQKQIEALEADVQTKMQKILTPEQLKQWTERRQPRGLRGDQPNADRPGGDRPAAERPNGRGREATDEPRSDRPRGGDPARTGGDRERNSDEPRRAGQGRRPDDRRDGPARGEQSSSNHRSTGPMARVVHQLNLSPEQQAKVDKVLQAHHEKTRALFRQAQAEVLLQMKEVLTEEQFQQFTKALENGPPGYRRRDRSESAPRTESATPKP
jgi:Spy/CpxP family protein refolding chaperone